MVFSYYPGCTLKTTAKDLDLAARAVAEKLGVELREIPEWQCCGGCYPSAKDEIAQRLSAVRALMDAAEKGTGLVTVCSACHNVVKRTLFDLKNDPDFRKTCENYLGADLKKASDVKVYHFAELLRDVIGFDAVRAAVENPLTGKKIGAYYGCLLLRPGKVMGFDDPENPSVLEDLIRLTGAEAAYFAARNECCGGYLSLEDPGIPARRSAEILMSAKASGADALVTACPLCLYNLKKNGNGSLPVLYLTELLAEAMGLKKEKDGTK